jgi:TonB family protein
MSPAGSPVRHPSRLPRFTVAWEKPTTAFRSSVDAVLHGPKPPAWDVVGDQSPLQVTWIRSPLPARALAVSSVWHIAAILVMMLPIWGAIQWNQPHPVAPEMHITWDLPLPELPPVSPPTTAHTASPAPKPSPPGKLDEPLPPEGADAYNPRQTILSQPQRVTHPRQTLIQPDAPTEPPKVVPRLPNIVEWGKATPAAPPKLQISASALAPILRNRRHDSGAAPDIRRQSQELDPPNVAHSGGDIPDLKMPVKPASAPVLQPRRPEDAAVPQIENSAPDSGALNIVPSATAVPVPRMPVAASSARVAHMPGVESDAGPAPSITNTAPAPTATALGIAHSGSGASQVEMPSAGSGSSGGGPVTHAQRTSGDAGAAPAIRGSDTGGDSSLRRLVALSNTPAPPSPNVEIPKGNLSARLSASPGGTKAGVPGGAPNSSPSATGSNGGSANATGGTGNAGGGTGASGSSGANGKSGPPGVSITSAQPGASSPMGGAGGGGSLRPSLSLQPKPAADPPVNPMKRKPSFGPGDFDTGLAPEKILGDKRIHTLYINLPNLTSASGSWVLNFAELQESRFASAPNNLSPPLAVRKVDPKYPTSLVTARVEGEVVLYAIIRADGSVDSIQVLKSLDPELDRNAIEAFARWRFSPATRDGTPVDLEAVVHIPFRIPPDF